MDVKGNRPYGKGTEKYNLCDREVSLDGTGREVSLKEDRLIKDRIVETLKEVS